jgi:hypothetical protein
MAWIGASDRATARLVVTVDHATARLVVTADRATARLIVTAVQVLYSVMAYRN